MAYNNQSTAVVKKGANEIIDAVKNDINALIEKGEDLNLPTGYNATKELRDAMLMLQNVKDRSGNPALSVCTTASISLALRSMVMSGLSLVRKQLYPIVYGNQLQFQMSYFGTVALVERMFPTLKVVAQVVYEGDTFRTSVDMFGNSTILEHQTELANRDKPILAAYCNLVDMVKREVVHCEIMTMREIRVSWSHAKTDKVQKEFPDQMAKRTVIQRACKMYLNAHSNEVPNNTVSVYNKMLKDEYEEDDLRDVTPPQEVKEKAKAIKGKSRGLEGLDALLEAEEPVEPVVEAPKKEEPQKAAEAPQKDTVTEGDVTYNTKTGEVVEDKDMFEDIPF